MNEDFSIVALHIRNLLNKVETLEKQVASLSQQNKSGPIMAPSRSFSKEHRMFPCTVTSVTDEGQIVCYRIVPVDADSTQVDEIMSGVPIVTRIPEGGSAPAIDSEIFIAHVGDGHFLPVGGAGGGGATFPGIIQGASSVGTYDAVIHIYGDGFSNPITESFANAYKGNKNANFSSSDYCIVYQSGGEYFFWNMQNSRYSGVISGGGSNPYSGFFSNFPGGGSNGSPLTGAYEMNGSTAVASGTQVVLYKVPFSVTFAASTVDTVTYRYYFTGGSLNGQQTFPAKIKTVVTPGSVYTVDIYENGFGSAATALNLTANQVDLFSFNYAVADQVAVFYDNGNYYIISSKPFQITNIPQLQFAKVLSGNNPYNVNIVQSPVGSLVTPTQTLVAYEFSGSTIVSAGTYVPLMFSPYEGSYYFFYPLGECS